jgi:hypothetical protein
LSGGQRRAIAAAAGFAGLLVAFADVRVRLAEGRVEARETRSGGPGLEVD